MRTITFSLLVFASAVYGYLGSCNGNIKLCDRSYSNITNIGTHNSAFSEAANLASNQERDVEEQLNDGIRFLQAQTHDLFDVLQMCHTSCFILDTGTLETYLDNIKKWIDKPTNQQQVVTLLLTNGDGAEVSKFDNVFKMVGLDSMAYAPEKQVGFEDWPTLQELIDSGKRLVVFMDYGANTTEVPYILNEFDYYFETPFDVTDASFNQCSIDRPPNAKPDDRMYLVNHYLDYYLLKEPKILVADEDKADTTNSVKNIKKQADLCSGLYGRNPNVMLVDFYNQGDVFTIQNQLNGL